MAKRILYLAENAISPVQGGGIVVQAALRGTPPSDLLGFYRYRNVTPALEYADRFHALPLLRAKSAGTQATRLPESPLSILPPAGPVRGIVETADRLRSLAGPLAHAMLGDDWSFVEERLRRESFVPEVVFAAPLTLRMLKLAVRAAATYRVPLVLLNMDDWMAEESARFGPLSGVWRRRIDREMERARPHVTYAYSNSPHLAERLTKLYGIPHDAVNNASPELLADGRPPWSPPPAREALVITYAGALNWNLQGETLVRVAEAVAELRAARPIELRIFTPWEFAPLANQIQVPGAVTYGGFRSGQSLVDAYLDSDVLLATTTFRDRRIPLFRYSLATKLSDYLCVGRPVLSVGHADWALHDYVEKNGCGIAVRTPDRSALERQLVRLLDMPSEERRRIGQANRALWERAHDVRLMARKVRDALGLGELT